VTRKTLADQSVIQTRSSISHLSTMLLDVNMNLVRMVPWQKAVTMKFKGSVNVISNYIEEYENKTFREVRISSPSTEISLPFIVSLVEFVYDPYASFLRSNSKIATKRAILTRDEFTCAYCGKKADTVDHIQPQSRGGQNTWTNLIAACKKCNNKKADRTPQEANMKLLWQPETYDGGNQERQQQVWEYLMSESGVVK